MDGMGPHASRTGFFAALLVLSTSLVALPTRAFPIWLVARRRARAASSGGNAAVPAQRSADLDVGARPCNRSCTRVAEASARGFYAGGVVPSLPFLPVKIRICSLRAWRTERSERKAGETILSRWHRLFSRSEDRSRRRRRRHRHPHRPRQLRRQRVGRVRHFPRGCPRNSHRRSRSRRTGLRSPRPTGRAEWRLAAGDHKRCRRRCRRSLLGNPILSSSGDHGGGGRRPRASCR